MCNAGPRMGGAPGQDAYECFGGAGRGRGDAGQEPQTDPITPHSSHRGPELRYRMLRYLTLLPAFSLLATPVPIAADARLPSNCKWVTGRLFVANGTPSIRIWPRGTKRILGVLNREGAAEGRGVLPDSISRLSPSFERSVWGTFHTCPLTRNRPGWMRMVYIDKARALTVSPTGT